MKFQHNKDERINKDFTISLAHSLPPYDRANQPIKSKVFALIDGRFVPDSVSSYDFG